jgi:flagellar biosynthetic protein fliR
VTIGFSVLIAILAGIMKIMSDLLLKVINDLPALFF